MVITLQQQLAAIGAPYSKTTKQLQKMAIRHWKEWLPKWTAELVEEGGLKTEALKAAERVQDGIRELRLAGYQYHEAEEVMLKRYILLPPEPEVIEEMERE